VNELDEIKTAFRASRMRLASKLRKQKAKRVYVNPAELSAVVTELESIATRGVAGAHNALLAVIGKTAAVINRIANFDLKYVVYTRGKKQRFLRADDSTFSEDELDLRIDLQCVFKLLRDFEAGKNVQSFPTNLRELIAKVKASPLNGTPNAISRLNPTQKKALKIIKDFGPIDGKTLAKELGIEYETLRSGVIKALKQHGVENPRNGTGYRLREPM
jgi:hypothetical protein